MLIAFVGCVDNFVDCSRRPGSAEDMLNRAITYNLYLVDNLLRQ